MKKYKFELKLKNGEITHTQESDDSNYEMKIPSGWGYEDGNYDIIKTDQTAEIAAKELEKQEKEDSKTLLQSIDLTKKLSSSEIESAVKALISVFMK